MEPLPAASSRHTGAGPSPRSGGLDQSPGKQDRPVSWGRRNCRQQDLTGSPPAPCQNGPGPIRGIAPAGPPSNAPNRPQPPTARAAPATSPTASVRVLLKAPDRRSRPSISDPPSRRLSQLPEQQRPRPRHQPGAIRADLGPPQPPVTLHLRRASYLGLSDSRQAHVPCRTGTSVDLPHVSRTFM